MTANYARDCIFSEKVNNLSGHDHGTITREHFVGLLGQVFQVRSALGEVTSLNRHVPTEVSGVVIVDGFVVYVRHKEMTIKLEVARPERRSDDRFELIFRGSDSLHWYDEIKAILSL
ncbi:MAG: hypothetical protein WC479_09350 [Candidatus Izemoplasmatales bacterium]